MFQPIEKENYTLSLEVSQGFPFVKMEIDKVDKDVFNSLKQSVEELRGYAKEQGWDLVYAHTDNNKIVRLWNRLCPLYDVEQASDGSWVGAWEVEN